MSYAGQHDRESGELRLISAAEKAHPELLFTERDRRQAHHAIGKQCMEASFYSRLLNQVEHLQSIQAEKLLDMFYEACGTNDAKYLVRYHLDINSES